jgi:predicted RNA-binding protein with PUA-like domain
MDIGLPKKLGELMNYWLMKSEPSAWSWDSQVKKKVESWNGVRNYQAANNMKAMKLGDRAFFYHSVDEKQIVGIVEICKLYHPDPTDETGKFGMVSVKALMPLKTPVSLAQIKAEPKLKDLALLRQSRLSVSPVDAASWKLICKMGGVSA